MNLVGYWQTEPHMYRPWDDEDAYVLECIDMRTLETLCIGEGNTPYEAVCDGVRQALRALS